MARQPVGAAHRGEDGMGSLSGSDSVDLSPAEAERQLAAAVERHLESVAATQTPGRSESGQHVAVKVAGRAVHLVSFALRRAAAAGVPFERLVELTGWAPDLVREGLERPVPEPRVIARLAPPGLDARAVAEAAASFEAIGRLQDLTQRLLADVLDEDGEQRPSLPPADVEDLHDRLETVWREWRLALGRRDP
jgi:hypothetical protein